MKLEWHLHATGDALAEAVAAALAGSARNAIAARGEALLVLAGGRTPLPAYSRFARASIEWPSIRVLPSDERWVARDHPHCNLGQLAACLTEAQGVQLMPLVPDRPGAVAGIEVAMAGLAPLATRDFDAVALGMGSDGHIASLFPGTDALSPAHTRPDAAPALVVHPEPLPAEAPYPRVSLSLPRLLRARRHLLVVRGDDKRRVLEQAIDYPRSTLPVTAWLSAASPGVDIHWSP